TPFFLTLLVLAALSAVPVAQNRGFTPVTRQMLLNPRPDYWLMSRRTYDAQRYSPLNQINKQNVGRLTQTWTRPLATGVIENITIVPRGVMRSAQRTVV